MIAASAPLALPSAATPVMDAAVLYAQARMPPVPVYGVTSAGLCTCHSGEGCDKPGKHPVGSGWQKRATLDLDEVRDRFREHRGNIGIYLGLTGLVLIDADGEVGLETARAWGLPETFTQQSGSGVGAHYVYRLAPDQDAHAITDRSKIAPGIDVKVRGQFVAAPSRHHSGGQYTIVRAIEPATMPGWLFDRIRKPAREAASASMPVALPADRSAVYERAAKYVAAIPGAISGSGGHDQTFAAARSIAAWLDKGLTETDCWGLLCEYNRRCEPPWTEPELAHKWENAKAAHTPARIVDRAPPRLRAISGGRGVDAPPPAPPGEPPPPTSSEPDWRAELLWATGRNGADKLVVHVENVIRILQLEPAWQGKIGFDEFRSRIVVADDAPWDDYQKPNRARTHWTDEDTTRLSAWLRRKFHRYTFAPSIADCERAVAVVARTHDFNPVRDYLDSVAWDGTARLSTWLATYLGAEDCEYSRLVGAWWLISACARVYQPGCKVDTVPILEGPQGIRKSSALRVLAGADFFNDTPIDLNSKDAYSAIQGCWFVELAELESLMRAEPSRSKAFLSSAKDRFRRVYARHETDELRQCIFVGTVNHGEYLSDPTGARRFWPIKCTRIDLAALERDRDQLWAEAVAELREGRTWYPTCEAETALLEEPQKKRTRVDSWEREIRDYLRDPSKRHVTVADLLRHALNLEPRDWTPAAQTRVGIIMVSKLGWEKRRITLGDERPWVYERPLSTSDANGEGGQ